MSVRNAAIAAKAKKVKQAAVGFAAVTAALSAAAVGVTQLRDGAEPSPVVATAAGPQDPAVPSAPGNPNPDAPTTPVEPGASSPQDPANQATGIAGNPDLIDAPAPVVSPIAWAQGSTVICNAGDQSAIRITHTFIMRDSVTGEDLLDHFGGAQATMPLSGGAGTTSQDTATISGALVTFDFVLSQPMRPSERLIPNLQIGDVSVPTSVSSIGFGTGNCTY